MLTCDRAQEEETLGTIQADKNTAKILNELLKAKCGLATDTGSSRQPAGSSQQTTTDCVPKTGFRAGGGGSLSQRYGPGGGERPTLQRKHEAQPVPSLLQNKASDGE